MNFATAWSLYFGIREDDPLRDDPSARHRQLLGRLAPYFERPWRRVVTPEASRVPRTVW